MSGSAAGLEAGYRARRAPQPPPAPEVTRDVPPPRDPEPAPAAAEPRPVSWELRTQAELVEHIEHYHAGLRLDLPVLIDGARRVEREHAGHAAVPGGLASLLETFASELEGHMQKEERGHADPHDGARARRPRGRARARSLRQHIYLENNVLFARAVGGES